MDLANFWNGPSGYQIERSLRFNSADSAYLNRTPASAGNRRTFTWSGWFKVGNHSSSGEYYLLGTNGTADNTFFYIEIRNNQLRLGSWLSSSFGLFSTQLFRDPSAWYHLVVAVDTTQATAANRAKAYVNGTEITTWSTANYPSQNYDLGANDARAHAVGAGYASGSPYAYWDGLLTECHFIDGQALTPSSFGETDTITGVWKPKKYAGSYGTNGFYLKFADNSGTTSTTLGKDSSGNSNNWTPNNFSVTAGVGNDSLIDTPTPYADGGNGRGNYCTLNPLAGGTNLSDGNLTRSGSVRTNIGTFLLTGGKFYFETTIQDSNGNGGVGVKQSTAYPLENYDTSKGATYFSNGEYKIESGAQTSGFSSFTNGDVIGCAVDATVTPAKIWWSKNGTWQGTGDPTTAGYSLTSGMEYFFIVLHGSGTSSTAASVNFGQRAFAYTPPSGFLALNTNSLPEPSIKKPNQWMDATTYTGTSASNAIVNAGGFQPDLVWLKNRNYAPGTNHVLVDAVRGVSLGLASNLTNAEFSTVGNFSSINSNGFTVTGTTRDYNFLNDTFVAWQWKESATPGFDIVIYTGNGTNRTIAHSLGVAPSMMIVKNRSLGTEPWRVYHQNANASPATGVLNLNTTAAFATSSTQWNNTAPTSSVFSVGTDDAVNRNGDNYVAYLWSEVAGFSKFGSYTGNGSADGPFVFCGFRPRWVMVKRTDTGGYDWEMYDSARADSNVIGKRLWANLSTAENSATRIDFLSNGFKIRDSGGQVNGGTIIFAAFAESPAKYSLAR